MRNNVTDWVRSRAKRLVMKVIVKSHIRTWMHLRYAEVRLKSGFESNSEWKLYSN